MAKQLAQDLSSGKLQLVDCPCPAIRRGHALIETRASLISSGTERMLVDFGRGGYLTKARQQPEKVKQVIEKIRTDGLLTTIDAVRAKLRHPMPMGYSNVGTVLEVGEGVENIKTGQRVVSNGPHSEIVCVPHNLAAAVPDKVGDEAASFTVVGSIALQGVRLAAVGINDFAVVIGTGLIGLLAVQLLRINGCRVLAVDYNSERLALATKFGAETCNPAIGQDPVEMAMTLTNGVGADAVLIAAATTSNEPVSSAARMSRKRGRIILVGVAGLELNRSEFYEKELSFQVSCSYGPGRYDPHYEEDGNDYPVGFVRWTAKRNFEAVLSLLADGRLQVDDLISHRFKFEDAGAAYDLLAARAPALGMVLRYSEASAASLRTISLQIPKSIAPSPGRISFIGAGNYASRILIPAFISAGAELDTLVTSSGFSCGIQGRRFGFQKLSTESDSVFNDSDTPTIVVATRHESHARLAGAALRAGKNVFVEKPLAITHSELEELEKIARVSPALLMVGFNRRFAPLVLTMKRLLQVRTQPKVFLMTINAGSVPGEHWTQRAEGGGRIIGEACHFVDLLRHLAGSPIIDYSSTGMMGTTADTALIQLKFGDGSVGSIHYFANGNRGIPKERLEVHCGGASLMMDNFRKLKGCGWPGFRSQSSFRQDKGQRACAMAFLEAVRLGGTSPILADELFEVSRVTLDIASAL
jgi:predicted dehydrogenase/threonine dehydrogenase-like Zn-dependent dehydrogenase